MRKHLKTLMSLLVSVVVLLMVNMICSTPVQATENSDSISWSIDGTTLVISGIGPMQDYEYIQKEDGRVSTAPWIGESFDKVVIEEGVTSVGNYAFYWCETVTDITLPNGIITIGKSSFSGCVELTNINLHEGITSIGANAFTECYSLPALTIPSSVKTIEDGAFSHCWSLTSMVIPEGVVSIGEHVFLYDENLSKITLPNSLKNIGDNAFADLNKLDEIQLPADLETVGKGLFVHTCFTEIDFLDNVTTIYENMFGECLKFIDLEIPEHITTIESGAFYGCWNMESVTIHEKVTSIDETAFSGCEALTTVYGVKGSYAETFATENGYTFIELVKETNDKEYTVEVTEEKTTISKEDFSEIIKENAEKDVVIKSNNDVIFTFPKGTMTEVKDMDSYDFGTEIIKEFDDKKEQPHKVHKDNFVTRINFNYSGKLPGMVSIKFFVGTDRVGATLHYSLINDDNSVTYIQSVVVDKDGYITVQQDHCSDYVVTTERIDVSDEEETTTEEVTTDNDDITTPDTGDGSSSAILLLLMGMAVLVVGMMTARKSSRVM